MKEKQADNINELIEFAPNGESIYDAMVARANKYCDNEKLMKGLFTGTGNRDSAYGKMINVINGEIRTVNDHSDKMDREANTNDTGCTKDPINRVKMDQMYADEANYRKTK